MEISSQVFEYFLKVIDIAAFLPENIRNISLSRLLNSFDIEYDIAIVILFSLESHSNDFYLQLEVNQYNRFVN